MLCCLNDFKQNVIKEQKVLLHYMSAEIHNAIQHNGTLILLNMRFDYFTSDFECLSHIIMYIYQGKKIINIVILI